MASSNPLFSQYRQEVLSLLLLHPEQRYHVREVARLLERPAPPVGTELNKLADFGVLTRERSGNQVLFQANTACPIFDELASIARKTFGLADHIAQALQPLQEQLVCAFIFGSLASNKATVHSDVDLMLIGTVRFETVAPLLPALEETIRREVNPKIYTPTAWTKTLDAGDHFLLNVMSHSKIFVVGTEEVLNSLSKEAE